MPKRPSFLSYENEIRLFALLLILLMMLVNWGTSSLFGRTSIHLREEEGTLLRTLAEMTAARLSAAIDNLDDPMSRKNANELLTELSSRYRLRRLTVVGRDSLILACSDPGEAGKKADWLGFLPEEVERAWAGMQLISLVYRRRGEGAFQKYIVPFYERRNEVPALIIVEKEQNYLEGLVRTARIELLVRVTSYGIAILFVSFFIAAILRPYRRMREAAGDVTPAPTDDTKDVEFVVKTFEETVRQLQEKERILANLHAEAERRAGDLARYNEYILGSIASGVVNCDERGLVTYLNRAAREVLRLTEPQEALIGKPLMTNFNPENADLIGAFRTAMEEREIELFKEVEWVESGRRHWLGVSSSPLREAEGRTIGTTFLLNDLTEIKRLQEEMLVKGRLATLGEISAGIAHEFRNSLGAITGFATLLRKKTSKEDPRREVVEGIVSEANQLEAAVSQFLKFASPEPLHPSLIRLNDLAAECAQACAERCRQIQVALDLRLSPNTGEVSLDAGMFRRALLNLLLNAIEAMPNGGTLTIETGREAEDVFLVVKDTGEGIPRNSLDRVFTPFFTTKEKGAGMGLAIVQKVVVSHGGRINIESVVGKGTFIQILLPQK